MLNACVSVVGVRVSLVGIWVHAGHWHIQTVECIASLTLKLSFMRHLIFARSWRLAFITIFLHWTRVFSTIWGHLGRFSDIFRIKITFRKAWDVRRHHVLLKYSIPIDIRAPWVILDATDLTLSYAPARIFMQHQLQQVSELIRNQLSRKLKLLVQSSHKHFILISRVERRKSSHHLVKNCPKWVVVNAVAIAIAIEHLWAHVLSWAAVSLIQTSWHLNLREAKICQLNVPIDIDEDVFGFEVTIKHILVVNVLKT